jgi:biotin operon repressor
MVGILVFGAQMAAWGQPQAATEAKVTEILRQSKILRGEVPIRVTINANEAKVTIALGQQCTAKDCKIDAVLLSKSVIEAFPEQITRVKVMFGSLQDAAVQMVSVTAGDVKAYGDGSLSQTALLSSLELVDVNSNGTHQTPANGVKSGPFEVERTLLSIHIDRLKSLGTNVKAFQNLFTALEASIGEAEPSEIEQHIVDLRQKLKEQDQLIKQADNVRDGHSISSSRDTLFMQQYGHRRKLFNASPNTVSTTPTLNDNRHSEDQVPTTTTRPPAGSSLERSLAIRQRLRSLRQSGQDVSSQNQQLTQAQKLMAEGNVDQARNIMDSLAHSLGMQ